MHGKLNAIITANDFNFGRKLIFSIGYKIGNISPSFRFIMHRKNPGLPSKVIYYSKKKFMTKH